MCSPRHRIGTRACTWRRPRRRSSRRGGAWLIELLGLPHRFGFVDGQMANFTAHGGGAPRARRGRLGLVNAGPHRRAESASSSATAWHDRPGSTCSGWVPDGCRRQTIGAPRCVSLVSARAVIYLRAGGRGEPGAFDDFHAVADASDAAQRGCTLTVPSVCGLGSRRGCAVSSTVPTAPTRGRRTCTSG